MDGVAALRSDAKDCAIYWLRAVGRKRMEYDDARDYVEKLRSMAELPPIGYQERVLGGCSEGLAGKVERLMEAQNKAIEAAAECVRELDEARRLCYMCGNGGRYAFLHYAMGDSVDNVCRRAFISRSTFFRCIDDSAMELYDATPLRWRKEYELERRDKIGLETK